MLATSQAGWDIHRRMQIRCRSRLAVAAMVLLVAALSSVPAGAAFQTFTTADGLAQDGVRSILEDDSGALWFGTYLGGVSRFDGVTWTTYDSAGAALPGNDVFDLHQDAAGDVWAATNLGVARFDGRSWRSFDTSDGLPSPIIEQIAEDGAGHLWFRGQGGGVTRYDGATFTRFTSADGLANDDVSDITIDRAGMPWFATRGGASRFDGSSWTTLTRADGLASDAVTHILAASGGAFWFAVDGPYLSRYDGQIWTTYSLADGLPGNVLALFEDANANIWAGTAAGVGRFDGAAWTSFDVSDGLADDDVNQIVQDRKGFLWFGADVSTLGVTRFDGRSFEAFTTREGLAANSATRLLVDGPGNLWLTSAGGGVTRFDGVYVRRFGALDGMASDFVQALAVDTAGVLWVGTPNGLNRFDGTRWSLFTTADGLPGNNVTALMEQADGRLWAGTSAGAATWDGAAWSPVPAVTDAVTSFFEDAARDVWVGTSNTGAFRYDGSGWTAFGTPDLISNRVLSIAQDAAGDLWFGTPSGASRYDGTLWFEITTVQGLPSNQVNALRLAADGALWFGTEAGAGRYDGQQFVTYGETDGLASKAVKTIYEDADGVLWFGTLSGATRFDGQRFWTFGEGDGLSGPRVTSIVQDPTDRFWFGTLLGQSGLTRYEPDRVPPRAVIVPAPPPLSSSRDLTFNYAAAFGENRVEFETYFDGVRRAWSGLNFFQQSGVSDGVHTFEVRARDPFGNMEAAPRSASFEIDATQPEPQITSPGAGDVVRGRFEITGTTEDARFHDARLLVRPLGEASWEPPAATLLRADSLPVAGGVLATWDTDAWDEGDYEIAAFVVDTLGLIGTTGPIRVTVDNLFPYFEQTAPARVSAATGGNVYTTHSEVKLFFPPNAFDRDAEVTIDAAAGVPDSLGPGIVRVAPAFDVGWAGARLEKPATLEMSYAGASVAAGTALAVYAAAGSTWTRIGGTAAPARSIVGATIHGPARYALFSEVEPPVSGRFLRDLTLAPRVFSPGGGFSNTRVAIGFTIGRPAPVTVKIYNRAGRRIRTVAAGQTFNSGSNLVYWDGLDRNGRPALEGVYLVTVEALDERQTKTLAVVR